MRSFPFQITYKGEEMLPFFKQDKRMCYFYEISHKKQRPIETHHHVLIIDYEPSQEMQKQDLKKCLQKTLQLLCKQKKRYVSLLAYKKEEGLVRILNAVKCDKISYKMAEVERLLEESIEQMSQGCLSHSLETALTIIQRLKLCCDAQHITLFTNGLGDDLKWQEQEIQACMQLGKACYEQETTLNVIGFGNYYDSHFFKTLIKDHTCSELIHVEEIKDYEMEMSKLILKAEAVFKNTITIQNKKAFLCEHRYYYTESRKIEGLSEKESSLLVTYDSPLQLEASHIKIKNKEDLSEVIPYYLYQWSAYLLKKGDIETAERAIAETKDLAAYREVCNVYTSRERGNVYRQLIQLAEKPNKRYKQGKVTIDRTILKREEPLCLLEVLYMILSDEESKLFWDYSYPYERIGPLYSSEALDYVFRKPTLGYGEIEKIRMGSKKLNIGVQVKVKGQVEELKTHLKLDGIVYREYNIMVNGNLNTSYLIAELSKKVKAQLSGLNILKVIGKQNGKTRYKVQLHKLRMVNQRLLQSIAADQLAHHLYELEYLKLQEQLIKKYLKTHFNKIKMPSKRQFKLYERFQMNEQGLFKIKQEEINEVKPSSIYRAQVVEWKIEKFPQKRVEEDIVRTYGLEIIKPTSKQIKELQDQYTQIKQKRQSLHDRIQMIRIASVLMEQPIWVAESISEKNKKKSIPLIEGNAVVGGKMTVATIKIKDIAIKEERYTLLVAHQ